MSDLGGLYSQVNGILGYMVNSGDQEKMVEMWSGMMRKMLAAQEVKDSFSRFLSAQEIFVDFKKQFASAVYESASVGLSRASEESKTNKKGSHQNDSDEGSSNDKNDKNDKNDDQTPEDLERKKLISMRNILLSDDEGALKALRTTLKTGGVKDNDMSNILKTAMDRLMSGAYSVSPLGQAFDKKDDNALKINKMLEFVQKTAQEDPDKARELLGQITGTNNAIVNERLALGDSSILFRLPTTDVQVDDQDKVGIKDKEKTKANQTRVAGENLDDIPQITKNEADLALKKASESTGSESSDSGSGSRSTGSRSSGSESTFTDLAPLLKVCMDILEELKEARSSFKNDLPSLNWGQASVKPPIF